MIKNHRPALSHEETAKALESMGKPPKGVKSVFGIGGRGKTVAEMFAALHGLTLAHAAHDADMLMDDEVFTGRTYHTYRTMFPDKPFWALVWNTKRMYQTKGRRGRFTLGKHDKAAILDPEHRVTLPFPKVGRRADGAFIMEQVVKARKPKATE